MKATEKKSSATGWFPRLIYHLLRGLVRLFYPKTTVEGAEHLPPEGCILVGNHAKMNGPIVSELYLPRPVRIWCTAEMMDLRAVPDYAYQDFWRSKPLWIRWFYRLASYVIAPFSVCVFNNAHTIPVYHNRHLVDTFRQTMDALDQGVHVVIFPECPESYNHVVNRFQERFADVAKPYYSRTGKPLSFVPMYVAPDLKKVVLGKPVTYCPDTPMAQERQRICQYLMDQITALAQELPLHTVVPYNNIPKHDYPVNRPCQENAHEDTRR